MKAQLMAAAVALAAVTAQAMPVPQGQMLTCRGEGQTIMVIPSGSQTVLQFVSNHQAIKVSTNMKYSASSNAYYGRVTEDTALKSKGFSPNGLITVDFAQKRFVVQDPYTGSASVLVMGIECNADYTAAL